MLRPRHPFAVGLFIGVAVALVTLLIGPHHLFAQTTFSIESVGSQVGLGNADLQKTVLNIIRWALGFVTLVAVAYMIYGGYLWLTAAGNEQRVEKAKQVILQAAIGLVIILLAWAIVLFVVKTATNVTGNNNPPCVVNCNPPCPLCSTTSTFDLTAITSCAAAPDFSQNVPRSSNISLTFNTDVTAASVKAAVEANGDVDHPKLIVEACDASSDASHCNNPGTPKPVDNQVFTAGTTPAGAKGSTKAEWLADQNTVTFYHLSFSTDPASPDNRYFEAGRFYRLTIPRNTAKSALSDTLQRVLLHCQQQPGIPIIGDSFPGEHCQESTDGTLTWIFKAGSDTDGPALQEVSTQPSSAYLAANSTAHPDRNIPRNAALNIQFNNAIDKASITTQNFRVYKFTAPPDPNDGTGGTYDATKPLDPTLFDIRRSPDGMGAWLQLKDTLFDSFTWYKVVVENFRNLCGTAMTAPYSWVFETNDVTPGVAQVYPTDGFANACPSTKVFIQYNTSMWKVGSGVFACNPGTPGSHVSNGRNFPDMNRSFSVVDQFDPNNQLNTCKIYAFTPESVDLTPGTTYHVGVNSDLTINVNGDTLNYGDTGTQANPLADAPSQGPWSFTVAAADKCIQPPVVTSVQPGEGQNGACVSVLGSYFLKPGILTPGANDTLTLGGVNQTVPNGAWNQQSIVSKVQAGSLPAGGPHPYQVSVDYGGQIGVLKSAITPTSNFLLDAGSGGNGICLYSLNPNQGQVGTTLSASGDGFGAYTAGQSKVTASGYPPVSGWPITNPATNWHNTQIDQVNVAVGTSIGQSTVRVEQGVIKSNPVIFDVQPPVTGVPTVVDNPACNVQSGITPSPNPYHGDNNVCLTADISADFTLGMDASTINTTNIILNSCTNTTTCAGTVAYTVTQQGTKSFLLKPTNPLTANTLYQVTITTGVKADPSAGGKALSAPYTWQFTTSTQGCQISGVVIQQSDATFQQAPFSLALPANVVDAACHIVNQSETFDWTAPATSSEPHVFDLQSTSITGTSPVQNIAANPPTGPAVGQEGVFTKVLGKQSNTVKITYNPTSCTDDSQCKKNKYGESCSASTCVNNACTPVVNGFEPDNGSVGTWTTIKGCWFGGYDTAKSKVTFLGGAGAADDQDGLDPNTTICGSAAATWENERIVREVPKLDSPTNDPTNDAVTGPVQITRGDSKQATSPNDFTVNTKVYPGLCHLNPGNGLPNSSLTATGIRFGADEPAKRTAQDQVNVTKLISGATPVVMSTYNSWSDIGSKATIDTAVPALAGLGDSEVRVMNDGAESNPWPFFVNDPNGSGPGGCPLADQCASDAAVCSNDATNAPRGCALPAGASIGCCQLKPKIISFQPPQNSPNACRNTAAQVTFSTPLDGSTVTPSTVRYQDGATVVNGSIGLTTANNQSTITYSPGLLTAGAAQQFFLTTTAGQTSLRSDKGVLADVGGSPLKFTTGANICTLDHVGILENTYLLTAVNQTAAPTPVAKAYAANGEQLQNIDQVYSWDWSWLSGNDAVATAVMDPTTKNLLASTAVVTAKANGKTYAEAKAKVTFNSLNQNDKPERTGRTDINVDICDNPWDVPGQPANSGYTDSTWNFKLFYCRGQNNTQLLPNFSYPVIDASASQDPTRLKSFFFKESQASRDTIGILIFNNPQILSPYDWFIQRFPTQTGAATTSVSGYPAVRTGTTTYIGVTDVSTSGTPTGLMFVFDYNSNNASDATKQIYDQMTSQLMFNINQDSFTKQAILNDTKRGQDLASVKVALDNYKTLHGSYPTLQSGTYLPGFSTSSWPSWQATLGQTLNKSLSTDPANTFSPACPSGYDGSTCWNEPQHAFQCPSNSHVYLYHSDGSTYSLYGHMESTFFPSPQPPDNPCTSQAGSSCGCFNYKLTSS